jgi:hypothetical protein
MVSLPAWPCIALWECYELVGLENIMRAEVNTAPLPLSGILCPTYNIGLGIFMHMVSVTLAQLVARFTSITNVQMKRS